MFAIGPYAASRLKSDTDTPQLPLGSVKKKTKKKNYIFLFRLYEVVLYIGLFPFPPMRDTSLSMACNNSLLTIMLYPTGVQNRYLNLTSVGAE